MFKYDSVRVGKGGQNKKSSCGDADIKYQLYHKFKFDNVWFIKGDQINEYGRRGAYLDIPTKS